MGQGKQAKTLTDDQLGELLWWSSRTRNPARDRVIVLLSFKAGLRACEIAGLTWGMVTDVYGDVSTALDMTNQASKGKGGGRTIPLNLTLRDALVALLVERGAQSPGIPVVHSQRGGGAMTAASIVEWFDRAYRAVGIQGASSHSGRRTFVTKLARHISAAGGSLRDVQQLAGHANLTTTQAYIEGDSEAKARAIAAI